MLTADLPLAVPATLTALVVVGWGVLLVHLRNLRPLPLEAPASPLRVCLCIPVRNEAGEIGRALDSWLDQDQPGVRIVVVDDGSTDGSTEEMAARRMPDRLEVIRNDHLPPGWLGKNHALDLAAAHPWAREADWLLFVDADVRAEANLLRRALHVAEARGSALLTLVPAVEAVTFWERLVLPFGHALFLLAVSPAWVERAGSKAFCGIGAFTLVRRSVYDGLGGHAAAPMEPVDDMMLARRVKAMGGLNHMARGGPGLRLRMYRGGADLVRGLRKNALGFPGAALLAPVMILLGPVLTLSPLWVAVLGWPGFGLILWLLGPAIAGEVHHRLSGQPADRLLWLWPLGGLPVALATGLAFWDRLRGVNVWRGRQVDL